MTALCCCHAAYLLLDLHCRHLGRLTITLPCPAALGLADRESSLLNFGDVRIDIEILYYFILRIVSDNAIAVVAMNKDIKGKEETYCS